MPAGKDLSGDVESVRMREKMPIGQGAASDGHQSAREAVIKILNDALATEIVCVLRYRRHYCMALGIRAESFASGFLEHAGEEQSHADQIVTRIVQLDGAPDFSTYGLQARSRSEYGGSTDLAGMLQEDLVAERMAIDTYREIIRSLGDDDPATCRMMETILASEVGHAGNLHCRLEELQRKTSEIPSLLD